MHCQGLLLRILSASVHTNQMLSPTLKRKYSPFKNKTFPNYLLISDSLLAVLNLIVCVSSCEPPFFQKDNHCVYITKPNTFEHNDCILKTYHSFDLKLYENLAKNVWLPVRRRYPFGPMFFQKPGIEYANTLESVIKNVETNASSANCMVIANNTLQYVDCFEKHPHLCVEHKSVCTSPAVPLKSCFCTLINSDNDDDDDDSEEDEEICELKTDFTTDERIIRMTTLPESAGNVCYVNSRSKSECRVAGQYIPKVDLILKFDVKKRKLYLTVYSREG